MFGTIVPSECSLLLLLSFGITLSTAYTLTLRPALPYSRAHQDAPGSAAPSSPRPRICLCSTSSPGSLWRLEMESGCGCVPSLGPPVDKSPVLHPCALTQGHTHVSSVLHCVSACVCVHTERHTRTNVSSR